MSQCLTAGLYWCLNVSLLNCTDVSMSHCWTVLMSECLTARLYWCLNVSLLDCTDVWMSHCWTVLMSQCFTDRLYWCLNVSLLDCTDVSMSHCCCDVCNGVCVCLCTSWRKTFARCEHWWHLSTQGSHWHVTWRGDVIDAVVVTCCRRQIQSLCHVGQWQTINVCSNIWKIL